jgi:hypothetical protein
LPPLTVRDTVPQAVSSPEITIVGKGRTVIVLVALLIQPVIVSSTDRD